MEKQTFINGNMSDVSYIDNKIYRSIKPYSSTIQKLLKHLELKGIPFVPHFLGMDDVNNREILSFVEGICIEDYPNLINIEDKINVICKVSHMLKIYHNATIDFNHSEEDKWFLEYKGDLHKDVICHNDIAPYNVTFVDNNPVGIIDFDTACPAPRIWDIAYALYRFVPLSRSFYDPRGKCYRKYVKEKDAYERKILIRKFLDEYEGFEVTEVLDNVVIRLQALVHLFDQECNNGNEAFIKMKEDGHQRLYIAEIEFIKENIDDWK